MKHIKTFESYTKSKRKDWIISQKAVDAITDLFKTLRKNKCVK